MKSLLLLAAAALVATPPALAAPLHARTHAKAPPRRPPRRPRRQGEHGRQGQGLLPPERSSFDRHGHRWRPADRLRFDRRNAGRPRQGLGRHGRDRSRCGAGLDKSADKGKAGPKPEASMFYTAYFKQGAPAAGRPITFLFNGGPGSSTHLAAHGRVRPGASRHRRRQAQPASALLDRRQWREPARRLRPRVHRRAGHRLQPDRRQGQGKGVLRSRPGHPRLHRLHHPVPDQVRPLELAQISVRRELRDDARARACRWRSRTPTSTSTA